MKKGRKGKEDKEKKGEKAMQWKIRLYEKEDSGEIPRLFYETVHITGAEAYTPPQLEAWAPSQNGTHPQDWDLRLSSGFSLVAEEIPESLERVSEECPREEADPEAAFKGRGRLLGFANLGENRQLLWQGREYRAAYLDCLYVHPRGQRQGIAWEFLRQLEQQARKQGRNAVTVEVSMTAKGLFQKAGYQVITPQTVHRRGVDLVNFQMWKPLL